MKTILNWLLSSPQEEGNLKDIMRYSRQWQRDLSAREVKKVNQVQAWATRQRNLIYDELNPTVKEARR